MKRVAELVASGAYRKTGYHAYGSCVPYVAARSRATEAAMCIRKGTMPVTR